MRNINVLLLLLASGSPCFAQEKMRVDIDAAASKTVPKTTTGKVMSSDNSRRNLTWRVDLSPSLTTSAGLTMLEIRVANLSAAPRMLPVSQDGVRLTTECPDHVVSEGAIFLRGEADPHFFLKVGYFYGCDAFPATIVQVKPGEWISYTASIPIVRLPKVMRAQIRFVRTRYQQGASGQSSEDLEYETSEFSQWVTLPEALGVSK